MGIVAKQSARNTVALSTGFLLGAINTIYVLPAAFEGFEEGWGLLRILTAWGSILATILAFGTHNGILRFLPKAKTPEREASMLSTLCAIPAVLFAIVSVALSRLDQDWLVALDAESGYLLQGRMAAFLFMAGAYLTFILLKSALMHRMRTVTVTVVQEVWLKGSYLVLAVVYLQGWMPFETFFRWFLGTYAAAVAMLMLEAWSVKLRPTSIPQGHQAVFGVWPLRPLERRFAGHRQELGRGHGQGLARVGGGSQIHVCLFHCHGGRLAPSRHDADSAGAHLQGRL